MKKLEPLENMSLEACFDKINEVVVYLVGENKSRGRKKYDAQFEYFWKHFVGRWNADKGKYEKKYKGETWKEWRKLTVADREKAAATARYAKGEYVPDPHRWLKGGCYDDNDTVFTPEALQEFRNLLKEN